MRKTSVSTSLEKDIAERLALLARVDNRSLAQIVAQAVHRGLAILEEEHADKLEPLRENTADSGHHPAPVTPSGKPPLPYDHPAPKRASGSRRFDHPSKP